MRRKYSVHRPVTHRLVFKTQYFKNKIQKTGHCQEQDLKAQVKSEDWSDNRIKFDKG